MITLAEVTRAVAGVLRLVRLDAGGLAFFDGDARGFQRSFWAAALVAPFHAYMVSFRAEAAADGIHAVLVEILAYSIGWLAYPVAAHYLTEALGCGERYLRYVSAYNWSGGVQVLLQFLVTGIIVSGLLPQGGGGLLSFGLLLAILAYNFYLARVALQIASGPAAALVAMDLLISLILERAVLAAHGLTI